MTKQELYEKKRAAMRLPFIEIGRGINRTSATILGVLGHQPHQYFSLETAEKVFAFIDAYEAQMKENLARFSGGATG